MMGILGRSQGWWVRRCCRCDLSDTCSFHDQEWKKGLKVVAQEMRFANLHSKLIAGYPNPSRYNLRMIVCSKGLKVSSKRHPKIQSHFLSNALLKQATNAN